MGAVVLYDGVCNFCSFWVRFVIERDPAGHFSFAPLQSAEGRRLMAEYGLDAAGGSESVVLIEGGEAYQYSDAALGIAKRLSFPWRLLAGLAVIPRPVRDAVYRFIARHRYKVFGKNDVCEVPPPNVRARFLN